jgi:DNA-damage-inducible protein D
VENGYKECVNGFESARKLMESGVEYWMARDVMLLLQYSSWDKFEGVVEKAIVAARSAGAPADNHFSQAGKMVPIGSGAHREKADWFLSRYACYLIAMNADSSKPEVGHAMTYFAIQARRQEAQDQLTEAEKRLQLRLRLMRDNRRLAGAAKNAGVVRYPVFQGAGYWGLYGMGLSDVKVRKGLTRNDELLDHLGRLELSAHDFRANLTEERLNRESIKDEGRAIETHRKVGQHVREVMMRDNGVRPEDLPTEPSIKKLVLREQRRIRNSSN